MTEDDGPVDLEGVRRGDALLAEAKRLHHDQGRTPRPVPLEEISGMPPDEGKHTYSTEEVAKLLGVDVQTVRRWCREGTLKAAKLGRHYRISRLELSRFWMDRGGGELFSDEEEGADE